MTARSIAQFVAAAIVGLAVPLGLPSQPASAAPGPCPDVDVTFARGTAEPAGLGITGTAFVESMRLRAFGKSVSSYAVNYPASADFGNPLPFAGTVVNGIRDAQQHIQFMATNCPGTRIVLGGYSQGAVVAGFATMDGTPVGVKPEFAQYLPAPLPRDVSNRVAAVVLFAKPSDRFMTDVGAPPVKVGPAYAGKTVEYCIPGDTICDGAPAGQPNALHVLYAVDGMPLAAADYATTRL